MHTTRTPEPRNNRIFPAFIPNLLSRFMGGDERMRAYISLPHYGRIRKVGPRPAVLGFILTKIGKHLFRYGSEFCLHVRAATCPILKPIFRHIAAQSLQ